MVAEDVSNNRTSTCPRKGLASRASCKGWMWGPVVERGAGTGLRDHDRVADLIVAHRSIDRSAISKSFIL